MKLPGANATNKIGNQPAVGGRKRLGGMRPFWFENEAMATDKAADRKLENVCLKGMEESLGFRPKNA